MNNFDSALDIKTRSHYEPQVKGYPPFNELNDIISDWALDKYRYIKSGHSILYLELHQKLYSLPEVEKRLANTISPKSPYYDTFKTF